MWDFVKILVGGIIGYGAAKLLQQPSENIEQKIGYLVFVRSEKFDKSLLLFDDYGEANKVYEDIIKAKKVQYKTIIEHDKDEFRLYEKWKLEGKVGKDGYPKLSDYSKVYTVTLEDSNATKIKEKKFK